MGTPTKPKDHLFVLFAVGMYEGEWRPFDRDISHIKLELADHLRRKESGGFPLADCEVKSNWIRNRKECEVNQAVAMKHAFFQRAGNANMTFCHIAAPLIHIEGPRDLRLELS